LGPAQALAIFDVDDIGDANVDYDSPFITESINKIAKVTNQPADIMKTQYDDIHPRVVGFAKSSTGKTSKNCWKDVTNMIAKANKRGSCHPIDSIMEGCILHHVFGISSSGVEQHFSKAGYKYSDRRLKAHPETEEYVIRAISDLPNHDLDTIIKIAKQVWVSIYGPPRKSSVLGRITKGVKRRALASKDLQLGMMATTEKEFIVQRRGAARGSSTSVPSTGLDYESLVDSGDGSNQAGWTEGHAQELKFQANKLHSRKVQAVAEGIIHGDASLNSEVELVTRKRIKDQRARERKSARDDIKLHGTTVAKLLVEISGRPSHILCEKTPELVAAMKSRAMKEVKPMVADIFIVDLPSQVGERVRLVTAMRGSFHVSPSLLTSGGTSGIATKWRALSEIPRIIFVSSAANAQNAHAFTLLKHVLDNCVINRIELKVGGTFDELDGLVKTVKPASKLVAIVRSAELKLPVSILVGHSVPERFVLSLNYIYSNRS